MHLHNDFAPAPAPVEADDALEQYWTIIRECLTTAQYEFLHTLFSTSKTLAEVAAEHGVKVFAEEYLEQAIREIQRRDAGRLEEIIPVGLERFPPIGVVHAYREKVARQRSFAIEDAKIIETHHTRAFQDLWADTMEKPRRRWLNRKEVTRKEANKPGKAKRRPSLPVPETEVVHLIQTVASEVFNRRKDWKRQYAGAFQDLYGVGWDAVLDADRNYKPDCGPFLPYCRRHVEFAMKRALAYPFGRRETAKMNTKMPCIGIGHLEVERADDRRDHRWRQKSNRLQKFDPEDENA